LHGIVVFWQKVSAIVALKVHFQHLLDVEKKSESSVKVRIAASGGRPLSSPFFVKT
jgi:hypothetical protein